MRCYKHDGLMGCAECMAGAVRSRVEELEKQVEDLRAEVKAWRWVPEILAGKKFEKPYDAKKYLEDELRWLRKVQP